MPYFRDNASLLSLVQQRQEPNAGFRTGQLGALHAVLAHFSVQDDPALICLPTGYGKTSLMMALPYLLRADRVLIVEPSDALRKQVFSHLSEMSTLRRIGALPADSPLPTVYLHVGRIGSVDEWRLLERYDVIVSTPASSSPTLEPAFPADMFDLVIFDEAHHAPAHSWIGYLQHLTAAKFVFLTATPFRRDNLIIPGKIVYRYPVTRAIDEGAFDPVTFRVAPVGDELNEEEIDRAIARVAVEQFNEDKATGFDHRLFVRASSILAAKSLVPLYQELGLAVEAINSRLTKRRQDQIEAKLRSGELEGIICVDMFGEGYDFPKLKIAALHAPHKSLVPTIQFIGRFARIDETTGRPTLIAPLSRIEEATSSLLREGVNLGQMIDDVAHARIQANLDDQAFMDRLPVRQQAESDYDAVTPLSLKLYAHVRGFHCDEAPEFLRLDSNIGRNLRIVKRWATEAGDISLVLTADETPPKWMDSDALMDIRHDAFLLMYFPDSRMCFIGSTRRTEKLYLSIMDKVCTGDTRPLSYEETSRARAGLDDVRFYNLGLKSYALNSRGETYRTLTGPQAERVVDVGDSRAYSQGHFFGSGMSGNNRETIGASSSSRIWSNQTLSIPDFVEWVETLNGRISGNAAITQTNLDLVRVATRLERLPDQVIAANWPQEGFKTNPRLRYRGEPQGQQCFSRLVEWELQGFHTDPDAGCMTFSVAHLDGIVDMCYRLGARRMITVELPQVMLDVESAHDQWMPLADWLSEYSPTFYAADKSSFEGVNKMAPPLVQALSLAPGDTRSIDWTGCEIELEFLPNDNSQRTRERRAALNGLATVQEHLEQHLLTLPDVKAIFYDHRTGEAADYICITRNDRDEVSVDFYHCKGAGGAANEGRVGDVYEVAGQLVKCAYYCEVSTLIGHMRARMNPVRHASPSYFVTGTLAEVEALLTATLPTKLSFCVIGVQPGIRRTMVNERLSDLMAFCIGYARGGGTAKAYWLVSE
ncbi:DEAD/DEAH box helicase [Shewanella oncorhynchi]|uniref:DEAD/DEAH box helicase n=1 Tax=Shewanella TaxID=22 RepID=UPI00313F0604